MRLTAFSPFIAALIAIAPATDACEAQLSSTGTHPSRPDTAPLLSSPVWGRPLTVIDYLLMNLHARLGERAHEWEGSTNSGLWTSPQPLATTITPVAFVDRRSGNVVLGLDIDAGTFTVPLATVCATIINIVVADAVGAGEVERSYPAARDNEFSHFLPPSLGAVTSAQERDAAITQLQQRTVLRASLLEKSTTRYYACERPALGDTLAVRALAPSR